MEPLAIIAVFIAFIVMVAFRYVHKQSCTGTSLFLFAASLSMFMATAAYVIAGLYGPASAYVEAIEDMGIMAAGGSMAIASGWLMHAFGMAGERID